jgi:hypothetical protein
VRSLPIRSSPRIASRPPLASRVLYLRSQQLEEVPHGA